MDRRIVLLLPLLVGVQCTGTETENPLVSFHASDCKKEASISTKAVPNPDAGTLASDAGKQVSFDPSYDGLQCIAWQKLALGSFRFELGNFHGSCGIDWKGSASIAGDGTVALHAVNSDCRAARCGWCMYDWAFDVRGIAEDTDAHLSISVVDAKGDRCESSIAPYDVTLPTSTAAQGILCRPAFRYAVDDHARAHGTIGTLNTSCDAALATSCAADLSCGPLASADDLRCLARCSDDSACPLPDVLSCHEGTCRLTQTW
ncbi:MAG: hypothetical protein ABIQ16_21845 [Polyangiaceae bacterium]